MKKYADVGLIGLAGSGKDTIADIICDALRYNRVSFALSLKELCKSMGWDGQKDHKGRKLLQDVGMSFREYSDDIWVNKTASTLTDNMSYVFTDVRFANEAEYIRKVRNGTIIRVIRPSLELNVAHQHISETGQKLIEVDHIIINDGSIDDLKEKILNILN